MNKRIIDLQPSQLFISQEKLQNIYEWLSDEIETYDPIPIKLLDDKLIITDGHTRLYALISLGYNNARVVWDEDELDWEAYKVCVDWCLKAEIRSVHNLKDRILNKIDYKKLWLDRCKNMHEELSLKK